MSSQPENFLRVYLLPYLLTYSCGVSADMYSVASACMQRVINFCKQYIPETILWISVKLTTDACTPYTLL